MIGALMEKGLFTIIRYGATTKDPLGKATKNVLSRTVVDGRLEQTTTVENQGQEFVVDRFRAFFPITADVQPGDDIQANGLVYNVMGSPAIERIPGFPAIANQAAILRYVGPVTP